ncbi:MAG: PA14 domain-containing protein [Vicinamibacteria bacterium]
MRRLLLGAARIGLGVATAALALALLRLGPVFAQPLVPFRALPLVVPWLLLAAFVALLAAPSGGGARVVGVSVTRVAFRAALASTLALAGAVALRGEAGLPGRLEGPAGPLASLPPGPIDLHGADLEGVARTRRLQAVWRGELRVPESGRHRLAASGVGRVELRLDGTLVLAGEGDPLAVSAERSIGRGEHAIEVRYERRGPSTRLRLEWARPGADGQPQPALDLLAPRQLGEPLPAWLWMATDALAHLLAALVGWLAAAAPWLRRDPLPSPRPLSGAELLWAALGYAAILALASWPLVASPARFGPIGQPDGRLNLWILAWDQHALAHAPSHLFDAPIFHPLPDALAFSENLLLVSLLAAPFSAAGGPLLGYNAALMLSHVVSGLGVLLLIRRATGDRLAAFAGGAIFAAGMHRWANMAHIHAQATLFLPLVLLALDRFLERRTLGRALLVGVLLAAQGASSVYLGAITATALATGLLLALASGLRGREAARLGLGLALGAVLLAPLALPYLRMREFQGEEFTLETLRRYSTTPESYLASLSRWYEPVSSRQLDAASVHDHLFPGVLPVLLGLAGLARAPRRFAVFALLASVLAVLLSLGPATALYRALHEHVVLFRGLRNLARFSLIPLVCLAALAGLALAGRRRLAWVALPLLVAESCNAPLGYATARPPAPAAAFLAGRPGAVAALPLYEDDTQVMLDGMAHWRPLLNGDSGFMPRPFARAMELLNRPLDAEGVRLLRALGVSDVTSRKTLPLPLAFEAPDERVYTVPSGPAAAEVRPAPAAATLWTHDAILLDLGSVRSVSRVTFEVGDGDWIDAPRVLVSEDGHEWREAPARASLADATLSLYRNPRAGLGELRLGPLRARQLRLDGRLPARRGSLGVAE